ncbi:MAG: Acidobacterial duplicated orphan permease (function unknown) [uncultured Cytophagales bacterium]|uniref:ABC transporter, fused permease protein n=1 Tax=uncultured Cytophagales bacterium TaxID=158755 RepID=A0A6J4JJ07_9SPHI|nr:MAG: Acidobacterial duplicated orphan permease (function unknown) [uncultured Cytophagales bacterium]
MIHNYLLTLLRNVRKRRFYALLNVGGLSIGLTVCLLIALYVRNEFRYDAHHQKGSRVVLLQQFEGGAASGAAFAPALKARLSGVEDATRLVPVTALLTHGPVSYYEPRFYFADSSVFNVLTVPLVAGNPAQALSTPYGLVLSEKMARKYFGRQNPIGKVVQFGEGNPLYVTGVMRDWPEDAHVTADFLCHFGSAEQLLGKSADVTTYWGGSSLTYLLLTAATRLADVQAQLPGFAKSTGDPNAGVWKLSLLPLRDIYLRYQLDGRVKAPDAVQYVYLFSAVAAFILVLACFNYINLASARAATRAREVGVRKALGASRAQLVGQFLGESAVFTVLAFSLAVGMAHLSLPAFNRLAGVQLSLDGLFSPAVIAATAAGLVLLTLVTGGYPALVLSAFRPVTVLKNLLPRGAGNASFRQVLVVVQFSVSVTMIVATLVVLNQLDYIQHKDLGYRQEQVLTLSFGGDVPAAQKERFRREVSALASVQASSLSSRLPGVGGLGQEKLLEELVPPGEPAGGMQHLYADAHFLRTFGIRLVAGRNLDPDRPSDAQAFLINRAALEFLRWKSIEGKTLGYYTWQYGPDGRYQAVPRRGAVVGVIEDYHQADLKSRIAPLMITLDPGWASQLAVKIAPGTVPPSVAAIEAKWKSLFPGKPFVYGFMDEAFERTYRNEIRTGQVLGLFAALAILISCLGLLGLAAFTAEQRTKEIGIRKVLGAHVGGIVALLSRDFLRPVAVGLVVALPLAAYLMHKWLANFAYRVPLQPGTFALAGAGALLIALLTVSLQAAKAAGADPVKSLRAE